MTTQASVHHISDQKSISYTKLPTDDKDPQETELCDTDSLEGSLEPDPDHFVTDSKTLKTIELENNGSTNENVNGTAPDNCNDLVYDDDHFSQSNSSLTGSIDIGDICLSPTDTFNSFSTDNSTNSLRRSKSLADEKVLHKDIHDKDISKKLSKRYHLDLSRVSSRVRSLPLRKDACDHKTHQKGRSCMYRRVSEDSCGIRDTLTSRMRYEKGHVAHENQECCTEEYMTPTQRKDTEIKQLRREVKFLKKDVEEKNNEIELLKQNLDREAAILIEQKENDKKDLRMELDILQQKYEDLSDSNDKSVEELVRLQNTISTLKESMSARERKNAEIYLEMYKKGQESAKFERNEELERLASKPGGHSAVTVRELLEKLMNTEMELAKWQSMQRKEAYESAKKPTTDADATIRFLKDSFFHYLTDLEESDNHLRAIIKIFNFTDPQKKRIKKAILERRKKKSSL